MLTKTPVSISFGAVDQKTGSKHVAQGTLALAQNVYQSKSKVYRKREGFTEQSRAADWTDTAAVANLANAKGLCTTGGALVLRGNATAHVYNTADYWSEFWQNKGAVDRVGFKTKVVLPLQGLAPTMAVNPLSNEAWLFGVGNDGYTYFSVYNMDTEETIVSAARVPGLSANTRMMRAFYDSGTASIWLLRQESATLFTSTQLIASNSKYYASGSSTPTSATFVTLAAGTAYGFDLAPDGGNGCPVIVWGAAMQIGAAPLVSFYAFLFDTATGTYKVVPGAVTPAGIPTFNHASLAKQGTGTHVVFVGENAGDYHAYKLNPSTLATVANQLAWATGAGGMTAAKTAISVYYDSSGGYCKFIAARAEPSSIENMICGGVHTDFVTATLTDNNWRTLWPASNIFAIGSHYFVLMAHDDENKLQCSYYLQMLSRPSNGDFVNYSSIWEKRIVARVLYSRGPRFHFREAVSSSWRGYACGALYPHVSGNKARFALQELQDGATYSTTWVEFDLEASMGPLVRDGNSVFFPAGWPQQYSGGRLVEMAPAVYPRAVSATTTAGGITGTVSVSACYAIRTSDGRVWRSAPAPAYSISLAGQGVRITVPTLRILQLHPYPTLTGTSQYLRVDVEIYCSRTTDTILRYVGSVVNDHTVDSFTYDVTTVPATTAEAIYTSGGVLDHDPVPPFRVAWTWRDRVFLSYTDLEGEVWASKESEQGKGREFSAISTFRLAEGAGHVRAGGAIDSNYCAIFKKDGAWAISGPGPDLVGNGNYTPEKIHGAMGCTAPESVVETPIGCMYQATDGGIWLIGRDLRPQYIGRGADDYKSLTVVASAHVAKAQQARFHMSDGKILVFDYGNPTAENPVGQWYVWTGLNAAVGAVVQDDVHYFVESNAKVQKQIAGQYNDNSAGILAKLKTAPIHFPGILQGFALVYRGQFLGVYKASHTVQVTTSQDYGTTTATFTKAMSAAPEEMEFRPPSTRSPSIEVTVEETGAGTNEAFEFEALAFEVGVAGKIKHLNTTQRMT